MDKQLSSISNVGAARTNEPKKLHKPHRAGHGLEPEQVVTYTCDETLDTSGDVDELGAPG